MEHFYAELAAHQALGRAIEHVGKPGFWRFLIFLLRDLAAFDNALIVFLTDKHSAPLILDEYDTNAPTSESLVPRYIGGLYLLDPFWQTCQNSLASGVYRLEHVAPDQFRHSEYFQSYFREAVGEDEIQLVINVAPGKLFSVSLGAGRRFESAVLGRLSACSPWIFSLVQLHWTHDAQLSQTSKNGASEDDLSSRVELAFSKFGAEVLSEREIAIARLVLRGNSSKAIALNLSISIETVKVHRRHLYNKLGIASQPELFALFLRALSRENTPAAQ
jgi:DNA-binding CsgD family transcriptional regulator